MPGYAYPVGATASDVPAKTITTVIASAGNNVTLFTATKKTRVNSILATNTSFGILPVRIFVDQGSGDKPLAYARVKNTNYIVAPLVSGDARVAGFEGEALTEFVLDIGDELKASCPFADKVAITLNLSEGVK